MSKIAHEESRRAREDIWRIILANRAKAGAAGKPTCERCGVRHRADVACFAGVDRA